MIQSEWHFLNLGHPLEARTSQHRSRVRSHVTKQQHRRERGRKATTRVSGHRAHAEAQRSMSQVACLEVTASSSHDLREGQSLQLQTSSHKPRVTIPRVHSVLIATSITLNLDKIYPEAWHPHVYAILVNLTPLIRLRALY